jgi:hypothetical protein
LRGSCEEDSCIAAWNGVLLGGGLIVGGRLNLLDVAKREGLVERRVKSGGSVMGLLRSRDLSIGNFTSSSLLGLLLLSR